MWKLTLTSSEDGCNQFHLDLQGDDLTTLIGQGLRYGLLHNGESQQMKGPIRALNNIISILTSNVISFEDEELTVLDSAISIALEDEELKFMDDGYEKMRQAMSKLVSNGDQQ